MKEEKGDGKKQPTSLLKILPYSMGGTCIYEMPLNKMFQSLVTLKWSCDEMQRNFLFNRSKGHGSGCTIALSGMHHYRYRVYCLTPPTSLCSDNTQYLPRSSGSDTKRVPAFKIKGICAGNTPYSLISSNRPSSATAALDLAIQLAIVDQKPLLAVQKTVVP